MLYMSAAGKNLKESYQLQAFSQWRRARIAGPVSIDITVYHGTKRRSDWDNFHKLSMDALTGIVWDDDSQVTA
jgi:Holliday junction resolvase RusA-like endonuclease